MRGDPLVRSAERTLILALMRESGNPCQQKAQVLHSLTMGSRLRGNDDAATERRLERSQLPFPG